MNVTELPDLFFLDTNILVYSFDASAPQKQQIAKVLIQEALRTQNGTISTQIVQEFLNVALRKFAHPMSISEGEEYLSTVLLPLCRHTPSIAFYQRALQIQEEARYSWYDSLVVTAAVDLRCEVLFSEDMQHGRIVQGVKIINPFTVQD